MCGVPWVDAKLWSVREELMWRRPSMEDDQRWKMTFDWRRPSVEDDLQWKKTFDWRWPSMEDDLQWKTTFHGRWPMGRCGEGEGAYGWSFPSKEFFLLEGTRRWTYSALRYFYFSHHLFTGAFLSFIPITLLTQNNIVTLLMYSHPGIKYLLNISEHFFLVTVSINLGVEEIINTVG